MTNPKKTGEKWIEVGSFGWLVRYEYEDHWLDFKAYECVGEESRPDAGRKLFLQAGWKHSGEFSEKFPDDAEVTVGGYVKWDGCAHLDINRGHFCGAEDVAAFAKVLTELHRLCLILPSVDRDCAGYEEAAPSPSNSEEPK